MKKTLLLIAFMSVLLTGLNTLVARNSSRNYSTLHSVFNTVQDGDMDEETVPEYAVLSPAATDEVLTANFSNVNDLSDIEYIDIDDDEGLVVTGTLANINVTGCDASDIPAPATSVAELTGITVTDNCNAGLTLTSVDSEPTGDCMKTIVRTYTITDGCGNDTTVSQNIIITPETISITATDDAVCYDGTAHLTASSTIAYLQTFTWMDADSNVLAQETISSGISHFNPEHQTSATTYYVSVSNGTTCQYASGCAPVLAEAHVTIKRPAYNPGMMYSSSTPTCYDETARLDATTLKSFDKKGVYPYYYSWWASDGVTLLKGDTVWEYRGYPESYLDVEHQISDSLYFIRIEDSNSLNCPYVPGVHDPATYLYQATVKLRAPQHSTKITVTDDAVCYGNTADLTATCSLSYPQYYTWWDKDRTTLLGRDTVEEGGISHFNPANQTRDSLYYVHAYDNTTCPYIPGVNIKPTPKTGNYYEVELTKSKDTLLLNCGDEVYMHYYKSGSSLALTASTPSTARGFKAAPGSKFDFSIYVYSGSPGRLRVVIGGKTQTVALKKGQYYELTDCESAYFQTLVGGEFEGRITTTCEDDPILSEAHVYIKTPMGKEFITATNDTVCYNNTASLTASSDIAYPQYYNWWAKDRTTLLYRDTVNSGASHFNPGHQISDSLYYVNTYNETNCPYRPDVYKPSMDLCPDFIFNTTTVDTTFVACSDFIPFFDAGGENGDITDGTSTYYYRFFKAAPGSQVVLHIDTLNLYNSSTYALKIYDGDKTGTLTNLYGAEHDTTITSTSGYLYLQQRSRSGYMGWKGYITTTVHPMYVLAESQVTTLPEITPTNYTDTTCQSSEPYNYESFHNIDVSTAGEFTIDSVFQSAVTGCDSVVTLYLTVNPSYEQNEDITICQSELPYTWRDTTFLAGTVTGDYVFNRQTVNGCDSIITLHLTINQATTGDTTAVAFETFDWYEHTNITASCDNLTHTFVNANGCDSIVTLHLTVKPTALEMDDLSDTILCNGDIFSVIPTSTDSIPAGTLFTWTVDENANVTGYSDQSTPVDAPISQTLTNVSDVLQSVVYHVTPMTDGCPGDTFNITVSVYPTPELTLTCPPDIYDTLEFGSCALLIAPEDLGTPAWAHSLGWSLISVTNNAHADSIYTEGEHVITWTMTDECGNTQSCEQHVFVIFPECPDAVDYEHNVYHGVRIDCDCWTQRNLESNKYSDGTDIPGVFNYYSPSYPDTDDNVDKFGRLYDWKSAINDGADNGYGHVQGICPEGWYLPTAEKYEALYAHGADALKSPLYWIDGGGSNSTGFTSLPAGFYNGSIGRYVNMMGETYYWSTSMVDGQLTPAPFCHKHHCDDLKGTGVRNGLSYCVRCIKEKEE